MTPKEKAIEILNKFLLIDVTPYGEYFTEMNKEAAKKCAYILIDEIKTIDTTKPYQEENIPQAFYSRVKKEIELL